MIIFRIALRKNKLDKGKSQGVLVFLSPLQMIFEEIGAFSTFPGFFPLNSLECSCIVNAVFFKHFNVFSFTTPFPSTCYD